MSAPPFDSANLSLRTGDDPRSVRANRVRLAASLGLVAPASWWWLDQVHGSNVVVADGSARGADPRADASVSAVPGTVLVVLTADCGPLALVCENAIGVVHAGWRGLMGGVVEAAVSGLRSVGHGEVRAILGPCIGPEHYGFGREDLDRAIARFGPEVRGRTADGLPALDVAGVVRAALARSGVTDFEDVGVCTAASSDHFSHRRDGTTGRQALVAVLEG